MIGSLAKCRTILEHLKADGITDELLQRIFAPFGLNLGGTSPEEIAVAILAELLPFSGVVLAKYDRVSKISV